MKILIVAGPFISLREPFQGGTEAFVTGLANALIRFGHKVDVLAKDADEKNLFKVITFNESPLSMKDNSFRACTEERGQQHFQCLQLAKIDEKGYDILHYNSFIPEIYTVAPLLKTPSLLTLHLPPTEKFMLMYQFFIKHSDALPVAVSSRVGRQWGTVLGQNVPVILNGIDQGIWETRVDRQKKHMLWMGRITREKNLRGAIQLANHLDRPLKIIGPVFDESYFTDQIQPLLSDCIQFLGHRNQAEIIKIAEEASVFLATAIWNEPFGLSTLEMLACGVPVVGFDTAIPLELRAPGISETVDSSDWKDLITLLKKVEDTSAAQCRTFAQSFSIEKMATQYVELYKQKRVERKL